MKKILVIEDKLTMRELINDYFREQGFSVQTAGDGILGLASIKQSQPDIILLDLMMPRMDGFEFLKRLRVQHQTPVIVITAKEDESDTIKAFELGADDYVNKPIRLKELHARIQAVFRRQQTPVQNVNELSHGEIKMDLDLLQIHISNKLIALTPTEVQLLKIFLEHKTRVLTKAFLVDVLNEMGLNTAESSLKVHVNNLRKKLNYDGVTEVIETVFGTGYRLKAL
ncbi:MAG: response regulator transcription factor [Saccharospirillaceae bacterium]|nr:response regulator transcription factor [Pseudomonadales bacterium]NRB78539.1 response regulator transcription factor [Saccharospirillaceae bacterium]